MAGLSLGLAIGTVSGIIAGLNKPYQLSLQPMINIILAIPAVVFAVMAMVWFGLGTTMSIFLVALLIFPIMHVNSMEGIKSIDIRLVEMASVFRVPGWVKVTRIYLPGFMHSFLAGLSLGLASSVRLTVMAELLGAQNGIGQAIAISRAYLETDKLFAYVIVLVIIVVLLEGLFFKPLRNYTAKWQGVK